MNLHRRVARWLAAASILLASAALASPTDPVLVLDAVRSAAGAGPTWVRIDGILPGDDLVQIPYPLQLVIHEQNASPRFVRYDQSGAVVTGESALLEGGLDPADAEALLAVGTPAPDGAVTHVASGRIEVMLPAGFPAGPAQAQLFVLDGDGAIVSNAVPFTIVAGGAP
jgi:hypothetical protein